MNESLDHFLIKKNAKVLLFFTSKQSKKTTVGIIRLDFAVAYPSPNTYRKKIMYKNLIKQVEIAGNDKK